MTTLYKLATSSHKDRDEGYDTEDAEEDDDVIPPGVHFLEGLHKFLDVVALGRGYEPEVVGR